MINVQELNLVMSEANELSGRASLTKREERRLSFLMSAASAIKAGASLQEITQENHNEEARRAGLPTTRFNRGLLTAEQRKVATEWKEFVERRDMTEGAPMLSHIGSYSGLGTFVPTEFFPNLFSAMKASDPVLSDDDVTLLQSTHGRVMTVPTLGDIANVASVIGEGVQDSSVDIANTGQALLAAYTYRTPRFTASIESFQDLDGSYGMANLFESFASDRLARGISADLVNGNGSNKTLGLVPSIIALASTATPILTAIGAGDETGVGSVGVGVEDLAALYYSVDSAYRKSPKAAWLMNDTTLQQLSSVITKQGLPLISVVGGVPMLHGKPVKVSPSMQIVSNGNYPVLFGDLSYWITRLVVDDSSYIKAITQAPGLAENGKIAFRAYMRADGTLAFTSQTDPAPVNLLRCAHS
jgi:HK97 family phage major capsid protein